MLVLIPRSAQTTASDRAQAGWRGPASGRELLLLVSQRERLAGVLMGLGAAELVLAGLVVEQEHDEGPDRGDAVESRRAGERVAGTGGEQAPLAGAQDDLRLVGVRPVADARHQLAGAGEHRGEPPDRLRVDVAAAVGRELEVRRPRGAIPHGPRRRRARACRRRAGRRRW
jgi:hypothetical protein